MSDDPEQTSRHVDHAVNDNDTNNEVENVVDNNPGARGDGSGHREEIGGRAGPDPTRYGDWEKAGRCIDF